ncbi:hypothetical protein EVJ58_g442 [Rhodofomes roseus]|uniref:Uncharacterized protein n=1 Tax=Rhodofomes roseus TaxID=34475 RepID=A0A4Y9Z5P0_9APHY|nr:hypothetical protein EVJ58_g442 [Rhodofomes roseus]
MLVYSNTLEEHIEHLDRVFGSVEQAGLTLSPGKCHLGYQSLLLLGQKVSRLGISTHKEKVDAIIDLAEPRNVKELQTFLGMMVYFSSYVPFYAWIAAPLFQLLKKDKKEWEWNQSHQEAFELCKEVLTNAPVRAYAIPGRPYRLYTDACDYGLAAILQQVQPIAIKDLKGTRLYDRLLRSYEAKEAVPSLVTAVSKVENDVPRTTKWADRFEDTIVHVERVIAYWSRILRPAERNYSPTEREALALKEGLIKFQGYLEGSKVFAITDHAALTWSKTFQNVNRRLLTWGTVFSAYPNMEIIHRAGRVHSNVDPVSRLRRRVPIEQGPSTDPTTSLSLKDEVDDPLKDMYESLSPKFEEKLLKVASRFCETLSSDDNDHPIFEETVLIDPNQPSIVYQAACNYSLVVGLSEQYHRQLVEGYQSDSHYREIVKTLRTEESVTNSKYPQYSLGENGLVYFTDPLGNNRLCIPQKERLELMKEAHDRETEGAHAGYHRTYNRLAATYYWPGMSRDIKRYTSTCDICQKSKPRRHAPVGLLQPIPVPTQPFEVITMDFIPELPNSSGFDNILVIVDKLTKYGLFIPTTTKITEKETAKLLFDRVFKEYGLPRQIISDRDIRWRGEFWKEVCRLMDIQRSLTTAYHPQADGQTEVLNQTLEISLRAYIGPTRDDWSDHVGPLQLSYNSTPHSATGFAPAYLLRGYHPITASKLLHSPESVQQEIGNSTHPNAVDLATRFEADRRQAREALLLGQVYQKRAYNKGRLEVEFEVGDQVVLNVHSLELLRAETGRGRKLLMKYDGPFEVIDKVSSVAYRIRLPESYGMHPVINIAHLEQYNASPAEFGNRPIKRLNRLDFNELPEYEVDCIVNERRRKVNGRRRLEYRVRWVGYGPESDEWLPEGRLRNAPEVVKEWKQRKIESRPYSIVPPGRLSDHSGQQ